ncbi:MAG: prolyl oligopeptidase family serine peptidase [Acidobacteriota bacterium]|jgi:dipeptidyl aminopeptidase/acylaminoacyl peptidase
MMRRFAVVVLAAISLTFVPRTSAAPQTAKGPTFDQFLGAASPLEVVAAAKSERVAWLAYEKGRRNVYTAAAPAFTPVKLTNFPDDDGVDLTEVRISADGSTVIFVRGSAKNSAGYNANPSAIPNGFEQAVWAARVATPGVAWKVMAGSNAALSPDGRYILLAREGKIYRARVSPVRPVTAVDRGEDPFIQVWGTSSNPVWSPDGAKIAFVSNRTDHSFIGVYNMATHKVKYMAPDIDFDTSPMWTADSKRIIFVRRPGTPFGQQSQAGAGGLGLPAGPLYQGTAGAARGGGGGGGRGGDAARGGAPGQAGAAPSNTNVPSSARQVAGLTSATFKGGYTYSIWVADVATGAAHESWHPKPGDRWSTLPALRPAGDYLVFSGSGGFGGRGRGGGDQAAQQGPADEWDRLYSLHYTDPDANPTLITTTDGLIEDATSSIISPDGKTFYYCTNATDIERRHIWAIPVSGGQPRQVTTGKGIETYPAPLASGTLATLSANWNMPMSLGIWASPNSQKIIFPMTRPRFPAEAHVEPELVITQPEDHAFEIKNQLFLPKNIQPGEKRPAMIFVHGGPVRQMLLGYHYRYVYHQFYAINEWLASQGYVVLSINYRGGIGYGRSFQNAPGTNARGNSEYQDVVAGAKYLQSRPDVDQKRIGIYGLSYGGLLTAQALARNSEIFAAGVDYAGVHLYGSSLDPAAVSYQSSAISQIDKWKSPVLIIQGDDDRNVFFAQTVGLVELLRQRDVYYELLVFPDDVHDSLIYGRWLELVGRMDTFLQKFLGRAR